MNRIFLIAILLLAFKCYSQELTGNWKVISYEDEIAYYNKSTDSISYKDSSRKNEADNFKKMSELLIFPITYVFDDKDNFTMNFPMMDTVKGKYQLDKPNHKLILIDEEGKKDELNYLFRNELLFIEMEMENGFIKLGFKRS
jgi:hypothetical protein